MEHTFMTIHNLSPDANILFASDSIIDILGYQPQEVHGKSCFDYFHPDEVPFARSVHSRGVSLDKAAVLHYARVRSRDGHWISCECCFTIVHDVLVACTSIYRRGAKSERRAIEAPQIRRIFSSSPRDPRYHMLEHLSPKFRMQPMEREPRAALILNRFTRALGVMFATNAVASILGVRPDQLKDKSFYECIAENCLADAIKCLESAKANDSIAYLRFWSRDPRREEDYEDDDEEEEEDEEDLEPREDGLPSSDSSDGGAYLEHAMDLDSDTISETQIKTEATSPEPSKVPLPMTVDSQASTSSSASVFQPASSRHVYDTPAQTRQSRLDLLPHSARRNRNREPIPTVELEAVVSCTSDGLVVVLRRARPPIPSLHPPLLPVGFENGLFAAPWGEQPIRPYYPPELFYTFRPPLLPQFMPLQEHVKASGGPPVDQLMRSIRDVAVFAWALVGINGNMAAYSHGNPGGESQPADGLPIWDPYAQNTSYLGPEPRVPRRWPSPTTKDQSINYSESAAGISYVPDFVTEEPQGYSTSAGLGGRGWPSSSSQHAPAAAESWRYTQVEPHAQPPPSLAYYNHPPTKSWVEAAASYNHQNTNNQSIPTTQAQDHNPGDHRHTWL
ncbi:hypothetical protein F5Y15DRAFT_120872 [Xylariaceae sp. FL0016]|nr:hypothetical protein F5Y15DRAFT_120872 [Xylariaceae sp. FL0016]